MVIDQAVIDYFRCPEIYGACRPGSPIEVGALDFFPKIGKSEWADAAMTDFRANIDSDAPRGETKAEASFPTSVGEIAEHLRLERYVERPSQGGGKTGWKRLQHKVYYAIRPMLGVSVRKYLQRCALRGWGEIAFPQWPVDRTVDRVMERFLGLSINAHAVDRIPFIWFWPNGNRSCCIVTHDVEEAAGVEMCDVVMDLDSSIGLASSFQFVPEERYQVCAQFLDRVWKRGFEVNVHDLNHDGNLYRERREFLRRAKKINRYVAEYKARGFRSAVLYRNLEWYDAFTFSYDMSVPNVAHLDPQRGGCCTVMPYFVGGILELPLTTIQDYSLFNIVGDYSTSLWITQTDFLVRNHGLLSFNVHPDYLASAVERSVYGSLLDHLARLRDEGRTYFARPCEVERWWRERSQMTLVKEGSGWQIKGPGSERAVIAYASAERGKLSYSFV